MFVKAATNEIDPVKETKGFLASGVKRVSALEGSAHEILKDFGVPLEALAYKAGDVTHNASDTVKMAGKGITQKASGAAGAVKEDPRNTAEARPIHPGLPRRRRQDRHLTYG